MEFDITDRVAEAWGYYDALLDKRIAAIAETSGVPANRMIKINPADFIEKNRHQIIRGYHYQDIGTWIAKNKTDDTFLISPLDAIEETAAQIAYKTNSVTRTIRASKCDCYPLPVPVAKDFFIRNHRQTPPLLSNRAISFGLIYKDEVVAAMVYDIQTGGVRGKNNAYELVRLAIAKNTRVHGGASKLQRQCEDTLSEMGITTIFSYSNATINNGGVYEKLGFTKSAIKRGQTFVIMNDNGLERLLNLHPESTDEKLARHGWIKTHIGGNRTWIKSIMDFQIKVQ